MFELLSREIRNNFNLRTFHESDQKLIIHCSKAFLDLFQNEFMSMGWQIPNEEELKHNLEPLMFTRFVTPQLGEMKFVVDMEQGYKIEQI